MTQEFKESLLKGLKEHVLSIEYQNAGDFAQTLCCTLNEIYIAGKDPGERTPLNDSAEFISVFDAENLCWKALNLDSIKTISVLVEL
jgi:hypothetical protein